MEVQVNMMAVRYHQRASNGEKRPMGFSSPSPTFLPFFFCSSKLENARLAIASSFLTWHDDPHCNGLPPPSSVDVRSMMSGSGDVALPTC